MIVLLGFVTSAHAQLDTESIPPELDQNDLFTRVAASRLAIIGTVIKSEGTSERISTEAALERLHSGRDYRASLYTIRVEEIVCRQSDFDSKIPTVDDGPQPYHLFVPFDESDLPNGHYREVLLPNQRYLLLLTEVDSATLNVKYKLDPSRIYYRGTGHNRGVIPLDNEAAPGKASKEPEVVDKFRRLCDAMRPPKPADKLGLLLKLADSGDPVLQKEAGIARASVQASMQRTESPRQQPKDHPR